MRQVKNHQQESEFIIQNETGVQVGVKLFEKEWSRNKKLRLRSFLFLIRYDSKGLKSHSG